MTACSRGQKLRQIAVIALCVCACVNVSNSLAQEDLADGDEFNALLRARTKINVVGEGDPTDSTRYYVNDFRNTYGLAIFLDRRVDPDRPLALALPEMRLEMLLREIALKQNMGLVVRDGYLYIGPRALCRWWPSELEALSKQIGKLAPTPKQYWQAKAPLQWDEGATPRELAQQMAGAKLAKAEADRIAHDIWGGIDGPSLPRWERLAIVCAGFDLVPEIVESGDVRLRPLVVSKTQAVQINVPASAMSEAIENIQRYLPDVKAAPKQGKLAVEGSSGEIKTIQSWFVSPAASKKPPKAKSAVTKPSGPLMALMTPVEVPARQLLMKLAEDAKCELVISSDVAREKVDAKIKPAWKGTREELLVKISDAIGLTCEFRDGKIVVANP
jgi:hypothetical protein